MPRNPTVRVLAENIGTADGRDGRGDIIGLRGVRERSQSFLSLLSRLHDLGHATFVP
jgi:hypothetical protein